MKPATEILKNTVGRIRHFEPEQKVRRTENNRRKRRFKPKKPVRQPVPDINEIKDFKTENKTRESHEKVPERFSNVLMTRAKVEEHVDTEHADTEHDLPTERQTQQTKSPVSDNFETTNMERNRVVLFNSNENTNNDTVVSLEVETEPRYLLSTTSRTFSEVSMENMRISENIGNHSSDSNEATERNSPDMAGHDVHVGDRKMDHVINVGLSIEEVERAAERKSVDDDGVKDTADPALYRFEYRVLADGDVAGDDLAGLGDNSFMSLNTVSLSPDGLYHPENAPTYEQLLTVDDDVLLQFEKQFGIRNENFNNHQEKPRSQEIVEKSHENEAESAEKVKRKIKDVDDFPKSQYPTGKFRSVENYPVPVPRDYPGEFTNTAPINQTLSDRLNLR